MTRALTVALIALSLGVPCRHTAASEQREWITLTNCQYVAGKEDDGDSFRVRCGTNEFIARLYFVDAPETNLRYPERTREQGEHFGATLDETMKAGTAATDWVRQFLQAPFTVHTRWVTAGGRSKESRYYVLIEAGGKSLAEALVSQGLAYTKGATVYLPTGEKAKAYAARLEALEQEARQKRVGLWAHSAEQQTSSPPK